MSKAGRPPAAGFISRLVYAQRWPILGTLIRALLLLRGTNISPASLTAPGLALPHGGIGIVVHFKTTLGRNVTIFQGVTVGRADIWRAEQADFQVVIDDDAVLCANAVVLSTSERPVRIGRGAVVGANSVVTQSVPDGEIWAGAPARKVGERYG
jgi:serine O-acetyltransferase